MSEVYLQIHLYALNRRNRSSLKYCNAVTWHLLVSSVPNPALSPPSTKLVLTRPRLVTWPRGCSTSDVQRGISYLPPWSLASPPGLSVLQRAAQDPPVAKLSPHQTHNSSPMYVHYILYLTHSEWVINANTLLPITPKLAGH